jgi:hypothetical protein
LLRELPVPYFRWVPISSSDKAKAKRVKILELPISDGRVWWYAADWTETVLNQFEKFDGVHGSNSHRKDDAPDCASTIFEQVGPRHREEIKPEEEQARKQREEQEWERRRMQEGHARMFAPQTFQPKADELKPESPPSPFAEHARKILGPGWRV